MTYIIIFIAAFLSGLTASLGLGGGMVLLVYLTIIKHMQQLDAQGINLLFFLPIATLSLIIHTRSHLVKWKEISPALLFGGISAAIFSYLAGVIGSAYIGKAFAVILIISGTMEFFKKPTNNKKSGNKTAVS